MPGNNKVTCDCRNDCAEDLPFPAPIHNRPGLSHIHFRIGTYTHFLDALTRKLNKDPLLSSWTYRGSDDPGIALLEGASILGDILTFYQELYANEAYLGTAQWRESIADLVRLTGYRLSPGVGGEATFAVEIRQDKNKTGLPVTVPMGFPIKAQVDGLEQAADFETLKSLTAYPQFGKFNLYRRLYTPYIDGNTTEFYVHSPDRETTPVDIQKGDRLLIGDPYPVTNPKNIYNCEIVVVDDIRQIHGINIYKIKGSLTRRSRKFTIIGYKLGRMFRHFGHNTPLKFQNTDGKTYRMENQLFSRPLLSATQSVTTRRKDVSGTWGVRIMDPALSKLQFPLDSEVDDLSTGLPVVVQGPFTGWDSVAKKWLPALELTLIRTINDIASASMTFGTVSGAASVLSLNSDLSTVIANRYKYMYLDIRHVRLHEITGPPMFLRAGLKETAQVKGRRLYFYGTGTDALSLKDRRLLFEKTGEQPVTAKVVSVQSFSASDASREALRRIILDTPVDYADFPNQKPLVDVYGNLVEAQQGKTEKEAVLGNGDNRRQFQSFKLPKKPLTYHNQAAATPPEVPELKIYVQDRLWTQVDVFFGQGPKEQIYIVREDEEGNSWVQFGDGETGSRLPTGSRNIKALYRTGNGAYGALKEETNPQAGEKLDRLDKLHMPAPASGGDEPETGDNAREAAPGKTQALGRLVSLRDYESEALGVSGVSKAFARWVVDDDRSVVEVTVLMETGRDNEFSNVEDILNKYNRCRGARRFPVKVNPGKRAYLSLGIILQREPTYKKEKVMAAVKAALGVTGLESDNIDGSEGLFGSRARQFGQHAYANRVEAVVQQVEGVAWAEVKQLYLLENVRDPVEDIPTATGKRFNRVVLCEADNIFCLHENHLRIAAPQGDDPGTEKC